MIRRSYGVEQRCFRIYGVEGQRGLAYTATSGYVQDIMGDIGGVKGKFIDVLPEGWKALEIASTDVLGEEENDIPPITDTEAEVSELTDRFMDGA